MPDYLKRAREIDDYIRGQSEIRVANRTIKRWLAKYLDEKGIEHDLNPRRVLNMTGEDEDYRVLIIKMRGLSQRMYDEVVVPELQRKSQQLKFRFRSFRHGSWMYPGQCDAKVELQYDGDWRFGHGEVK